jgi:hypothetical protein
MPGPASRLTSPTYQAWVSHLSSCRPCADFFQGEEVKRKGIDLARFPCVHLAYYTATWVEEPPPEAQQSSSRKTAIVYQARFDEFGIHLFDGSVIGIRHCPWCGVETPPSRREEWFARLKELGFEDPLSGAEKVPPEYQTDAWFRR